MTVGAAGTGCAVYYSGKAMNAKIDCTPQEARKLLVFLLGLELALVALYVLIQASGLGMPKGTVRALFDLSGDLSIPAWFSSVQLFVVGGVLLVASRNNRREQHLPSWFLVAGSLVFFFLSVDEGAAIHERITGAARSWELNWLLFKGGQGAWIAVYASIAVLVALSSARYFGMAWRHFRRETLIGFYGAAMLVIGAVGFEIISYLFLRSGSTPRLYKAEVVCEEFLEMSGVSVILYAALLLAITISSSSPAMEFESAEA